MRLTQHLAAKQICLRRPRVFFFLVFLVKHVEGSLGVVIRNTPVGSPVTPVVRGGIVGRGVVAGLGPSVAAPVVSQQLGSTHVALVLALYKHEGQNFSQHIIHRYRVGQTVVSMIIHIMEFAVICDVHFMAHETIMRNCHRQLPSSRG